MARKPSASGVIMCLMDERKTDIDADFDAELASYLSSCEGAGSYRVLETFKSSDFEVTEKVVFCGRDGGELGPFVRKRIDARLRVGTRLRAAYGRPAPGPSLPQPAPRARLLERRRAPQRAHGVATWRDARGLRAGGGPVRGAGARGGAAARLRRGASPRGTGRGRPGDPPRPQAVKRHGGGRQERPAQKLRPH